LQARGLRHLVSTFASTQSIGNGFPVDRGLVIVATAVIVVVVVIIVV
jgi:hypothetical protein